MDLPVVGILVFGQIVAADPAQTLEKPNPAFTRSTVDEAYAGSDEEPGVKLYPALKPLEQPTFGDLR